MIDMITSIVWKELAANFVRDWGDIWNTDSERTFWANQSPCFFMHETNPQALYPWWTR